MWKKASVTSKCSKQMFQTYIHTYIHTRYGKYYMFTGVPMPVITLIIVKRVVLYSLNLFPKPVTFTENPILR